MMMTLVSDSGQARTMRRAIVLAGLAGGLAEVIWIGLFCALTPLSGDEVLRQITASFFPAIIGSAWAPALGLALHFVLSIGVAWAFGVLVWRTVTLRMGTHATLYAALLALTVIWSVNFFVVLPVVNAAFVDLMPYPVTFASKLLFGTAMALSLSASRRESMEPSAGLT
jgi:hypothetical protein